MIKLDYVCDVFTKEAAVSYTIYNLCDEIREKKRAMHLVVIFYFEIIIYII